MAYNTNWLTSWRVGMNAIGAFEAKTRLSQLLDRVSIGEEFIITRHGVPVAKLVPAAPAAAKKDIEAQIRRIRRSRRNQDRGRSAGTSLKELIAAGRKY